MVVVVQLIGPLRIVAQNVELAGKREVTVRGQTGRRRRRRLPGKSRAIIGRSRERAVEVASEEGISSGLRLSNAGLDARTRTRTKPR